MVVTDGDKRAPLRTPGDRGAQMATNGDKRRCSAALHQSESVKKEIEMDGGAVVFQIIGMIVLLSWVFLGAAAVAARQQGAKDAESCFLGWLAQRDSRVWDDYIAFKRERETAWRREVTQ